MTDLSSGLMSLPPEVTAMTIDQKKARTSLVVRNSPDPLRLDRGEPSLQAGQHDSGSPRGWALEQAAARAGIGLRTWPSGWRRGRAGDPGPAVLGPAVRPPRSLSEYSLSVAANPW